MKLFSISELEHYSGVKAHTLRIWEIRYQVPKPARVGSARAYTLDEFKMILDLALLSRNGSRISKIAHLSPSEIEQQLGWLILEEDRQSIVINRLLVAMYRLDLDGFEQALEQSFERWPVEVVVQQVIFPFLQKTGLLIKGSQLTEEHLAVTSIRKKLTRAIEQLPKPSDSERPILLFLSGTRDLDLALLYTCFRLNNSGRKVIYMGNDVSLGNLKTVIERYKPDSLYTYFSKKVKLDFDGLADFLQADHPEIKLFWTGPEQGLPEHPNLQPVDFETALSHLCRQPQDSSLAEMTEPPR